MTNMERGIQAMVFILLLIGLFIVTGWASYQYIEEVGLKIAGIAISWAVILLVLYVIFQKLEWDWWNN